MPPGWYADPQDPARLRWWDGFTWTAQTVPHPAAPTAAAYQAAAFQAPSYQPPEIPSTLAPSATARQEIADLEARLHALRDQYNELRSGSKPHCTMSSPPGV